VRVHAVAGTKDARLSVRLAYDAIAAGYDEQVRGDSWMRHALHSHYARVFRPGDRVLDVGCGTGIDALFLARAGIGVVGVDASPEMIAQLRAKISGSELAARVEARVLRIEEIGSLAQEIHDHAEVTPSGKKDVARIGEDIGRIGAEGRFDGIVSAFASLSSLPDLAGFARDAARLVRPGGRLILHLLNRFSLWEWLGYVAHRDWQSARAVGRLQKRDFVIGGQAVTHSLYFAREAYHFFGQDFALRDAYSLGALRPPHTVNRIPRPIVSALEWADLHAGRLPLLQNAGRFFVLDLERRRST
jgi:SAM-dependent methyltransferase